MAARGSEAKAAITAKIMETFQGAFMNEKELRIPFTENGERVEIKVTLTCAKTNVGNNDIIGAFSVPLTETKAAEENKVDSSSNTEEKNFMEPTEQEKQNVIDLLDILNLPE